MAGQFNPKVYWCVGASSQWKGAWPNLLVVFAAVQCFSSMLFARTCGFASHVCCGGWALNMSLALWTFFLGFHEHRAMSMRKFQFKQQKA